MGKLSVTGETMIFRQDHEGRNGSFPSYSTTYSRKDMDGSYENRFIEVKFRKDVEVKNKTMINIDDGFLTFRKYTANGGNEAVVPYIMVLDFKEVDFTPQFSSLQDDDIPF